jgi:hypothetical protein
MVRHWWYPVRGEFDGHSLTLDLLESAARHGAHLPLPAPRIAPPPAAGDPVWFHDSRREFRIVAFGLVQTAYPHTDDRHKHRMVVAVHARGSIAVRNRSAAPPANLRQVCPVQGIALRDLADWGRTVGLFRR